MIMMLAVEYMLLHTIFEAIKRNDEKEIANDKLSSRILANWEPLSKIELNNIRSLTN